MAWGRLDFDGDFRCFDGLVAVTLTNPDASTASSENGLKENVRQTASSDANAQTWIVSTRWHVPVVDVGSFVPAEHGKITDPDGNEWYINDVSYDTLQSRWAMDTTLQSGLTAR